MKNCLYAVNHAFGYGVGRISHPPTPDLQILCDLSRRQMGFGRWGMGDGEYKCSRDQMVAA